MRRPNKFDRRCTTVFGPETRCLLTGTDLVAHGDRDLSPASSPSEAKSVCKGPSAVFHDPETLPGTIGCSGKTVRSPAERTLSEMILIGQRGQIVRPYYLITYRKVKSKSFATHIEERKVTRMSLISRDSPPLQSPTWSPRRKILAERAENASCRVLSACLLFSAAGFTNRREAACWEVP